MFGHPKPPWAGIWFGTKLASHMQHLTCGWSPARPDPLPAYVHCHGISLSRAACAVNFLLFLLVWTTSVHDDLISLPPTALLATRAEAEARSDVIFW
ncbi:hypothetical protein BDA96_06G056400 [Sorghum bicolor]|uniref:Uncharacterized protein n=2 Tax=Sorghum bicolor TaxID=4558 RepID=A0A921UB22_SORBI|nr:hypothetical protein BDA96_06G056400 [Sorghum bicolor]OQU81385.1 hypothetical protein SORBI_3006G050201 [Sorghum bicolor]